ncbi:hypothetical protein JXB37_02795 [candidate division WOR-3 bacterium]|nr:hypothetical protein [candidate division WOR-3 bacterium]
MKILLALALPALLVPALGQNLLTNGDFEQELTVGWTQEKQGIGLQDFTRDTGYDPDPDYEARVYQYSGPGIMKLGQLVPLPDTGYELSFRANFRIEDGSPSCWPVGSVGIEYCNAAEEVLGRSLFYLHDEFCTWTNSPTEHLVEVTDPDWREYRFQLGEELRSHLTGVDPADVSKVRVLIYNYTSSG